MTNDESRPELTASEPAHQEEDSDNSESGATAQILAELQALRSEVADLRQQLERVLPDARSEKPSRGFRVSLRCRAQRTNAAFKVGNTRRDWQPPRPRLWDAIALLILTISGFLLRFVHLTTIPPGMHGDEAFATLLARRVMDGERSGFSPARLPEIRPVMCIC